MAEGPHEAVPHQVIRHVRDEPHLTPALDLRHGGRLVAAELELAPQVVHHVLRAVRLVHPLLKGGLPQALRAGTHQYDYAAVTHGVLGVVQRLLQLVEVEVLGCAALAHHHYVCVFVQLAAIQAVQLAAGVALGGHEVAAGGVDHALVLVQHHVDDEVQPHHAAGLLQVQPHGALHVAGVRGRVHHEGVVGLDGLEGADSRHDGLGAAGIAGKVVVLHVAQRDAHVGLGNLPQDVHGRAMAGLAKVHEACRVPVEHGQLAVVGPHDGAQLVLRLRPVATKCNRQQHVLVPHARGVQLVHDGRQYRGGGKGARHVAGDDAYALAGPHEVAQVRRADGVGQRLAHHWLSSGRELHVVCVHDLYEIGLGKLEDFLSRADSYVELHVGSHSALGWRVVVFSAPRTLRGGQPDGQSV